MSSLRFHIRSIQSSRCYVEQPSRIQHISSATRNRYFSRTDRANVIMHQSSHPRALENTSPYHEAIWAQFEKYRRSLVQRRQDLEDFEHRFLVNEQYLGFSKRSLKLFKRRYERMKRQLAEHIEELEQLQARLSPSRSEWSSLPWLVACSVGVFLITRYILSSFINGQNKKSGVD